MKRGIRLLGFRCFYVDPREEELLGDENNDPTAFTSEDEAMLKKAGKGSSKKAEKTFRGDFHDDATGDSGGEEGSGYDTREERDGK